ncbi:hypothetical protein T265_01739 [Opisthorchis viverrini]|uniref:Uncharacterized protein n=1 Tax=Opisthorchis viverrini TaxID=6198 RepID=A0A074ZYG5_OPIVI|nr:hypothetical protein T265_01739 [Opisthorchis viverrini]KER32116.1 hypothetical protein T265_01739 [Opisthorchis viverrini]
METNQPEERLEKAHVNEKKTWVLKLDEASKLIASGLFKKLRWLFSDRFGSFGHDTVIAMCVLDTCEIIRNYEACFPHLRKTQTETNLVEKTTCRSGSFQRNKPSEPHEEVLLMAR